MWVGGRGIRVADSSLRLSKKIRRQLCSPFPIPLLSYQLFLTECAHRRGEGGESGRQQQHRWEREGRDFLGMPAQVRNAQSVRKLGGRERGEEGRGRRGTESLPRWEGREGRWRVKGHSMQADKMEAWGGKKGYPESKVFFCSCAIFLHKVNAETIGAWVCCTPISCFPQECYEKLYSKARNATSHF